LVKAAKSTRRKNKQKDKDVPSEPRAIVRVSSKDVYDWIEQIVSKKNPKVGERICPYAAKTVKAKTIQVMLGESDLVDQIRHCGNLFGSLALECVIIYIQYKISEKELARICAKGHQNNPNFAVLYDHPDNAGLHKGVSFSFGKCPLIFIQPLKELKDAQSKLRRTAYYRRWGLDGDNDMFY